MAFELLYANESNYIGHGEEELLKIASKSKGYPQLKYLWDQFYSNPRISDRSANEVVHELISIRKKLIINPDNKYLISAIDRLLPSFSEAYKLGETIRCISD